MMSDPLFYKLLLVGLLWLCLMLHVVWPDDRATSGHQTSLPAKAPRKRSKASTPLPGLTHKPPCAACEHATASRPQAPCAPPSHHLHTRTPPRGEHLVPLLSRSCLSLWRLARAGQYHVQRASQRRPLATAALHELWRLLPRDPRHPVAWQARGAREARVGGGRAGGRLGHSCRSPGV
jgi:hypothetical protein